MKKIYMNLKAYEELCRELKITEPDTGGNKSDDLRIEYTSLTSYDDSEEASDKGIAEIILINEKINEKEPYVFYKYDGPCKENTRIRIYANSQEFTAISETYPEIPGYTIENTEHIQELDYARKEILLKKKYGLTTAFICMACVITLKKY